MVPSVFDAWAAEDVFNVIDELTTGTTVDARVVLNQATPTIIAKEALQSLQSGLEKLGLPRFRGHLPKGGYDVSDGSHEHGPAPPPAV